MPALIRLYIIQTGIGFAIAAAFTALLIVGDVAGLGHLVRNVEGGYLAAVLLFLFNGIVFAGAQFGIRLVLMSQTDGKGPRGSAPVRGLDPVPAEAPTAGK